MSSGNGSDSVPLAEELSAQAEALAAELKELSARVDGLAAAKPAADTGSERAARAFAIGALRQAAEKGGAFANDLGTLAALGIDASDLSALKPLAAKGAPSGAALAAAFPAVADAILAAAATADPNAGFLRPARRRGARLRLDPAARANARRYARGRGLADERGGRAPAISPPALDERGKLPEAGRAASAAWAEAAADRVAIDRLVGKLAAVARSVARIGVTLSEWSGSSSMS